MNPEARGRAAAAAFRIDHQLGSQPLGDLVALIEQTTGIDVAVLDVGPDEHGLTMRDPVRDAVMIAVAQTQHPMRQRSTLAHELAHVVFEDWTDVPDIASNSPREQRANAFARHLLVPGGGIRATMGTGPASLSQLSKIVQLFGVSPAIASIAMHDEGVISEDTKREWMPLTTRAVAAQFGWSDHYESLQQIAYRTRAPQKLLSRLIEGYVENVVSLQTIATVRGHTVDQVMRQLSAENISPRPRIVTWANPGDLPDVETINWDGEGQDSTP